MKESDLYLPLKKFLESQNYEVKGEVRDCDVVAVRGEEALIVVELKLTLNLKLVLQAVQRLSLTPMVYLGIPRRCKILKTQRKHIVKLLRMLGLGLIVIEPERKPYRVEVLLDPGPYKPRESKQRQQYLLGELSKRKGDPNLGGMEKRKGTVTAYRQQALRIAQLLLQQGPSKAADVALALEEPKARDILYKDFYGWFDRVSRGIYDISPRGKDEIAFWKE